MTNNSKQNVAEIVTGKVLETMRATGKVPWQKPWASIHYQNAVTGHKYRGVNVLMLALFGTDTHYVTFKQVQAGGGRIKEGAKSEIVTYWLIKDKDKAGKPLPAGEKRFSLLYYRVFGLKDTTLTIERKGVKQCEFSPIEQAEKIAKGCGVEITHGGNRACYSPAQHKISMPNPEQFKSPAHYYAVLFHEITHAMSKDCGEKLGTGFGSEPYAKEELVAEMGSQFLLSYCGIDSENLYENTSAYLQNWMEALANEPKLIVSAAGAAQRRFDAVLKALGVITGAKESEPALEQAAA
jgi:antirestriction protein ArdC